MKTCYKILYIIALAILPVSRACSQDVGFSQFYDQPFLRNPALAGIFTGDVRLVASFRNQWQSVTVPYKTFGLSSEIKMPLDIVSNDNLTLGLQLMGDVAGTSRFSSIQILPAVNYSLPLGGEKSSYLSFGVMGGLVQQQFDPSRLVLNDQFISGINGSFRIRPSSRQVFSNTNLHYLDLSTGISYNGVIGDDIDWYVGTGMFHLVKPQVSFFSGREITLNKKVAVNLGISGPIGETDQLILYGDYFSQLDYAFKRVGISSLQIGVMYNLDISGGPENQKFITFGALYRREDALIPVIQLDLSKFVIGLSYDINVSKLVVASHYRGGLEVTLSFRDVLNYMKSERRQTRCPRFNRHNPNTYFYGYD